jgi:membrane protein YdbS with pleckstrin-like domain
MQEFTNETTEIIDLPRFEEAKLNQLQAKYFTVVAIVLSIVNFVILLVFFITSYFQTELFSNRILLVIGIALSILIGLTYLLAKLSFNKKGYAFRTHDAIYKSGLISETTTIIPFNRVQHVALHQGFFSRKFGLASVELFTAGGNSSDIKIPGLLLEDAQKIKNLVSKKINPDATNELHNVVHNNME